MSGPFEFLLLPAMQRACLLAAMAGPAAGLLGSFVTLRKLAFFSHSISHSAVAGVALGFALHLASSAGDWAMQVALAVFCLGLGLGMAWLFERSKLPPDTVMAFTFTGSIAFGAVIIAHLQGYRVLEAALFGDILAAGTSDVWFVAGVSLLLVLFLWGNLRALCLSTVSEPLAQLEGVRVRRLNYLFLALVALVVAVFLRQLGALLLNGVLIIPAAAARCVAGNLRRMLALSTVFGLVGALGGVVASYHLDTPTGPTIVLADLVILAAAMVAGRWVGAGGPRKLREAGPR